MPLSMHCHVIIVVVTTTCCIGVVNILDFDVGFATIGVAYNSSDFVHYVDVVVVDSNAIDVVVAMSIVIAVVLTTATTIFIASTSPIATHATTCRFMSLRLTLPCLLPRPLIGPLPSPPLGTQPSPLSGPLL